MRSALWREPERPGEHFSQESTSVLDVVRQQCAPSVDVLLDLGLNRLPVESLDVERLPRHKRGRELVAAHLACFEGIQQRDQVSTGGDRLAQTYELFGVLTASLVDVKSTSVRRSRREGDLYYFTYAGDNSIPWR
jgi:hypothetical protein